MDHPDSLQETTTGAMIGVTTEAMTGDMTGTTNVMKNEIIVLTDADHHPPITAEVTAHGPAHGPTLLVTTESTGSDLPHYYHEDSFCCFFLIAISLCTKADKSFLRHPS